MVTTLLGQGQQGLGKQHNILGPDRDFLRLGLKYFALNANNIANVVLLETGILFFAHLVDLHEQLDTAGGVLQVAEHNLALAALAHQTAGNLDVLLFVSVVVSLDGSGISVEIKLGDQEGITAFGLQSCQLIAADLGLLGYRQFSLGT